MNPPAATSPPGGRNAGSQKAKLISARMPAASVAFEKVGVVIYKYIYNIRIHILKNIQ